MSGLQAKVQRVGSLALLSYKVGSIAPAYLHSQRGTAQSQTPYSSRPKMKGSTQNACYILKKWMLYPRIWDKELFRGRGQTNHEWKAKEATLLPPPHHHSYHLKVINPSVDPSSHLLSFLWRFWTGVQRSTESEKTHRLFVINMTAQPLKTGLSVKDER